MKTSDDSTPKKMMGHMQKITASLAPAGKALLVFTLSVIAVVAGLAIIRIVVPTGPLDESTPLFIALIFVLPYIVFSVFAFGRRRPLPLAVIVIALVATFWFGRA
jgi:hypothetical protein